MQLATTAKTNSDNVTGSLSYINTLVSGSTLQGLYHTHVRRECLNDAMITDLQTNYGYSVNEKQNSFMGTHNDYIISWEPSP